MKEHIDNQSSLDVRISVLDGIRKLFHKYRNFHEMPKQNRYEIGGLVRDDSSDYGWFGSMCSAWEFKNRVNENEKHLSKALDQIPNQGKIERDDYSAFTDEYKKAFPNRRDGIATATRLLAMKRPDVFVCLGGKNRRGLCKAFGISQNVDYDIYWPSWNVFMYQPGGTPNGLFLTKRICLGRKGSIS